MKKLINYLPLVLALLISIAGCSSEKKTEKNKITPIQVETPTRPPPDKKLW